MNQKYDEMTKVAAVRIMKVLSMFETMPDHLRTQAEQITMQRVQRMRSGEDVVVEGEGLIKDLVEPEAPEPVAVPEEPKPVEPDSPPETPAP